MPSVLFTHSYFYRLDPKQWDTRQPYPPLGTLLAAAVIRSQQYSVSLFDAGLASSPEEIIPFLNDIHPSYVVIYDDGFNYLTKMCLTVMRESAFTMSGLAKKHGSTVIICSSDATDHYENYLLHGVDYVIRGEGEVTLKELLSALDGNEPFDNIQGLAYLQNGKAVCTPPRAVMQNLDDLPIPAWGLVDMAAYRRIWIEHHGYFSLNVATTRGCPYKCNWCAKPIYGNRYNSRSPLKVADEIELLLDQHAPDHIWMCDDIFGLRPGWIQSFRDEVRSRKLKFRYKIQSRVDLLLQPETVDALYQSGAETVWVGAESGSQKILTAMDKGITVQQIYETTHLLRRQGIRVAFFLQFGYPGETKSDIDDTLKMVLDLMPDDIGISVSYPLPGTKFYENVKGQFSQKQNWKDSDDLDLMFHNTYRPAFYKILHRYIHCRYRMNRGIRHMRSLVKKPLVTLPQVKKILSVPYYFLPSMLYAWQLKKLSSDGL